MLDDHSLDVITQFKKSVLSKSIYHEKNTKGTRNRGNKLETSEAGIETLEPKIVEYEGRNQLIWTSGSLERSNAKTKRKWTDFYGEESLKVQGDYSESESEAEKDSEDEHPLKKIRLTELLSPLAHPSEVVSHPAISRTYKSQVFDKMSGELIELIEVEQKNLNWLNKLLSVLNGEDWFYILEEHLGLKSYDHGLDDDKTDGHKEESSDKESNEDNNDNGEQNSKMRLRHPSQSASSEEEVTDPFFALPKSLKDYEEHHLKLSESDDEFSKLQEELVNYLQVSIQRQQEYIKNLSSIRGSILRANRLKQDIYKWGKEMHDRKSS